jgi:hypothetical protein
MGIPDKSAMCTPPLSINSCVQISWVIPMWGAVQFVVFCNNRHFWVFEKKNPESKNWPVPKSLKNITVKNPTESGY